jgi:ParB/RepB/Spo0J family partition protein
MAQQTALITEIRPNIVALRPPQTDSEEYIAFRENVRANGILVPLRVRKKTDESTQTDFWELIDGLQRLTIAKELGLTEVPITEATASDIEVLVQQIATNCVRVTTQPAQYAQQLVRLMIAKPAMSKAELAQTVGMSEAWVEQRLSLVKLIPQIQELVDAKAINVSNAYQLSRLPAEEQAAFVEQAQTSDNAAFTAAVQARLKEMRKIRMAGRDPNAVAVFEPAAVARKSGELKAANVEDIVKAAGAKDAVSGGKAVLDWVLQLDAVSIEAQKARYEARRKEQAEKKAKDKAERASEQAEKAAKRAEELKKSLGLA